MINGGSSESEQLVLVRLRPEAVTWRPLADEIVGLDLRSSHHLGINAAGSVLWQALAQGTTRFQLLSLIVDRFEVERERAALDIDIDRFLADLDDRGFLEEVTSTLIALNRTSGVAETVV